MLPRTQMKGFKPLQDYLMQWRDDNPGVMPTIEHYGINEGTEFHCVLYNSEFAIIGYQKGSTYNPATVTACQSYQIDWTTNENRRTWDMDFNDLINMEVRESKSLSRKWYYLKRFFNNLMY